MVRWRQDVEDCKGTDEATCLVVDKGKDGQGLVGERVLAYHDGQGIWEEGKDGRGSRVCDRGIHACCSAKNEWRQGEECERRFRVDDGDGGDGVGREERSETRTRRRRRKRSSRQSRRSFDF